MSDVETRPIVSTSLRLPEGQQSLPSTPLLKLWQIAEHGPIIGEKFRVGFERRIDQGNLPDEISVVIYRGSQGEFIWAYTIGEEGIKDVSSEKVYEDNPDGLPKLTEYPTYAEIDLERRIDLENAQKVVSLVEDLLPKNL